MPHDLELLLIDVATGFAMSPADRIERTREPDGSPAPRLFFAGCPQGNIVRVRYDVEDETAARLLAIATEDPPWQNPWTLPQCMGKLIDVLLNSRPTATGPASRIPLTIGAALIYQLPNLCQIRAPGRCRARRFGGGCADGSAVRRVRDASGDDRRGIQKRR
jgi:hypothetical protein